MQILLGYILYFADNILREALRIRNHANRYTSGKDDKLSSLLTIAYLMLVPTFPLLNVFRFGIFENAIFQWCGLVLQIIGIGIRISAMRTLGTFYTGTLYIVDNHQLVTKGLYSCVRHPGYFAVLLVSIGFGLAVGNWIVLAMVIISFTLGYSYRISVEEKMLIRRFGLQYINYKQSTRRIIAFIY